MDIRSANRPLGFMTQKSGANSTPDEMEVIRMRSQGGRADIPSFYEETGSLPVAKTLARHYKLGGRRRYQQGGWLKLGKAKGHESDPYDYEYNPDTGQFRSEGNILGEDVAGTLRGRYGDTLPGATPAVPEDPSAAELLAMSDDELAAYNAARDAEKQAEMNQYIDSLRPGIEAYNQAVPLSGRTGTGPIVDQSTTVAQTLPMEVQQAEEARVEEEPVVEPAPVTPGTGGGATVWKDPRTPYTGPEVQGLGYQPMTELMAGPDIVMPDTPETEVAPLGPGWWDENRRGITRGASNVAAGLLNIAPHLANIRDYQNMPGVRSPQLQRTVSVDAPSMEATRQAIKAQGRTAAESAAGQSPQNQLAARAAAMSGTQSALSRLAGQEAQTEAQYDAMNARARQQAEAQNVASLNRMAEQMTARDLAQMRGIAGERGAISTKTLGFLGDLNRQQLDRDRMDLVRQRYNMQEQMDRAALKQFEETGILPEYYRKPR